MKKFSGIFLAVLLIFTAVSCSFFMEEKNNNSGSLVSFSLAGKASKAEDNGIEEYITYGESTVKYGTWSDLTWDIWYYVTTDSTIKFTTPSEIHKLISDTDYKGWKQYNSKPFIVEKGNYVWAYCENIKTTDSDSPVVSYMFKGIADKKVEKTKTIVVIEPKIDEAVAFKDGTEGSLKIKKLVYKMSKDQFESLTSESDIKKLKVTIKVGGKEYTTVTDVTFTDLHPYGEAEFDPIEITGIEVSESGTTPSDIVVEFIGMKDDGTTTASDCEENNIFDMSSPTDSAVEVYILNNLETELESLVVENKTIGVATVYINTTTTDMFPKNYNKKSSELFHFEAKEANASVMLKFENVNGLSLNDPENIVLLYAVNEDEFKKYTIGKKIILDKVGDKVYFKAENKNDSFTSSTSDPGGSNSNRLYYKFVISGKLNCNGNINYLLEKDANVEQLSEFSFFRLFADCAGLMKAPELPALQLNNNCYECMFLNCTGLKEAPELPATTLSHSCYASMFRGCTELETAPELPATTLSDSCYANMFYGCTSLETAPELPSISLAPTCYGQMFSGCTSLKTAPELPAKVLANSCYNQMFKGCTSLTDAPVLYATTLVERCYFHMFEGCSDLSMITVAFTEWNSGVFCTTNWVAGVSSTGSFRCPTGLPNTVDNGNKIPSGWNVERY